MRKIFKIVKTVLVVIIILTAFSGCGKAAGTVESQNALSPFASFRDIPGVTEEEIQAIEAVQQAVLQREYPFLSFGVNPSTEAFFTENHEIGGFVTLFCEWLSGLFGIPIQPVSYAWNELSAGLDAQTIDFIGNLMPTAERRKIYSMSDPISQRQPKMMRLRGSPPLERIAQERLPKYALLRNSIITTMVIAATKKGTYEIVDVSNINEGYEALLDGRADLFIDANTTADYFLSEDVYTESFFPLLFYPVSLVTANPELAPIISVVNKALRNGAIHYVNRLNNLGYEEYKKERFLSQLTPEEKTYLRNAASVPLAAGYYNYPVAFYNSHEDKWEGIAFDVLAEVGKFTGLTFHVANNESTEFADLLQMLKNGTAHIFPDLPYTESLDDQLLWTKNNFISDQYALLSKVEYPNVSLNEISYARVGMVADTVHAELFHAWFPGAANTRNYTSDEGAFHALDYGEVDLIMSSKNRLLSTLNYYELPNYKVNYLFNNSESSFAFNKNQDLLRSIIDMTLPLIDTAAIVEQWMTKTYDYRVKVAEARLPWLIGAVMMSLAVLSLALISLYRSRMLMKAVTEKTSLLKTVLDSTPDLIFVKDTDLRHTECNKALENHFNMRKSEFIGKNDEQAFEIPAELVDEYAAQDRKVFTEKQITVVEGLIPGADGEVRFFETIKSPIINDGKATGLVGISRDITHRKAAEESMNRQNLLMGTVNAAAAILLVPDTDGGVNAINRSMEMVCQSVDSDRVYLWENVLKDDGKLYCKQVCKWMRPEYSMSEELIEFSYDDTMPAWKKLFYEGKGLNGPMDTLPENGLGFSPDYKLQSLLAVPLFLKGEMWGFVSFEDCHSRRFFPEADEHILRSWGLLVVGAIQRGNIMGDLEHAVAEAKTANRAKSSFLASMSHEIRTPMNAILGITEIQLQSGELSEDTKNALNIVYNSGYTLLGIINDLLDLSKIEAGKLELVNDRYEIASLINDTININAARIGSKPIEFKLEVDENLPFELIGDELRIKQILNNLLSNAFKYTEAGEIRLSVAARVNGEDAHGIILTIIVCDTGQGMTEEQAKDMFDTYSRFNMETNRFVEGTGLGMNIVQNLVKKMDGDISVNSAPGKGTKVTVHLTQGYSSSERIGSELAKNLSGFRLFGMSRMKKAQMIREHMPYGKVLVVDDMETNLYVAKGFLLPYDLTIDTALSGKEAIEKIKRGEVYDIVFMDHMMPGMGGIETVKAIREKGYTHPIVALTANAVLGQAEKFMANGFDGFISKPIDIRELNASLNKFVRDRQPPEVVEAARAAYHNGGVVTGEPLRTDPELAKIFTRDAEKAIAVLQGYEDRGSYESGNLQMYIINVHAMKSALANIGETKLSDFAKELEKAGRDGNTAFISEETPSFMKGLRELVDKLKPETTEDEAGETTGEDLTYMRKMLSAIKEACAGYDIDAAMAALTEIKQKPWPGKYGELFDTISMHLLHSDFDEAEAVCASYLNSPL